MPTGLYNSSFLHSAVAGTLLYKKTNVLAKSFELKALITCYLPLLLYVHFLFWLLFFVTDFEIMSHCTDSIISLFLGEFTFITNICQALLRPTVRAEQPNRNNLSILVVIKSLLKSLIFFLPTPSQHSFSVPVKRKELPHHRSSMVLLKFLHTAPFGIMALPTGTVFQTSFLPLRETKFVLFLIDRSAPK